MPSPFPGMDPYLEGDLWMTVHTDLIGEIVRILGPLLRPRYVALSSRRFVLAPPDDVEIAAVDRFPDVAVSDTGMPKGSSSGAAVAPAPLVIDTVMPERIPHYTVEIRDVAERRLVTAIEVLSPTNKRGEGRAEYIAKRERILMSPTHLLEIDLLRLGERVPMRRRLPDAEYFVFLSRAARRPHTEVWPIRVDERLPTVPVPLLPGDADVPLDLQRALSNLFETVNYDLIFDYSKPPPGTLSSDQAAWVDSRLREAGKRA